MSFMMTHPYLGAFIICYSVTVLAWGFANAFGNPSTIVVSKDEWDKV